MKTTKWNVITGAPSSGKTTIINELAKRNFKISDEVARRYIEKLISSFIPLSIIRSEALTLQRKILAIKLKREHKLACEKTIFFDRGVPDSIAYFRLYGLNLAPAFNACRHFRYNKIFFCSRLPLVHDGIRVEDENTATMLNDYLLSAYTTLGYEPIILPPVSVDERLEILLKNL